MKAICVTEFGEPEVLKLTDLPDLTAVPGQILVRVHTAGVNPVETYIRSGKYAKLPPLPYTPGTDGAGIIADIGQNVEGWRVGQRVYVAGSLSGTYAEQTLCLPAHLHPLPDSVSFAQGAAMGIPYSTAHFALFGRGGAVSGETVLIHGATGGVGLAALQLAKHAGLTVLATGGTEEGRELLRREGAHHVFDHHAADYCAQILEATEGKGVNLVVEMLANVNLGKDLPLLALNGRVSVVGSRGPVEINPRDLMARNADVRGVMLALAGPEVAATIHRELVTGLESGALRPIVAKELPLADAPAAHRAVMAPGAGGEAGSDAIAFRLRDHFLDHS